MPHIMLILFFGSELNLRDDIGLYWHPEAEMNCQNIWNTWLQQLEHSWLKNMALRLYKFISGFSPHPPPVKHGLEVTAGTLEKRNAVKWIKYTLIHNFLEAPWLLIETFVYFIEQ